jgi:hypothetical protein
LGGLESSFIYYFLSRRSFVEEGKNRMKGAVGHKRVAKDWIANHLICLIKIKIAGIILNFILDYLFFVDR